MISEPAMDDFNTLGIERFTALLGDVFEHSSWVAQRAWKHRPFADVSALHRAMVREVQVASSAEKLALLQSHPELAGRPAQQGELTAASAGEQARAGLNALSAAEMERITELNRDYRTRHGFPFIVCVGLHTKASLMQAFERRSTNDREVELEEALDQVAAIARLRLDRMFAA